MASERTLRNARTGGLGANPPPCQPSAGFYAEKIRQAEPANTDWDGYIRGLYRGHYGHDVDLGEEHEWQAEKS